MINWIERTLSIKESLDQSQELFCSFSVNSKQHESHIVHPLVKPPRHTHVNAITDQHLFAYNEWETENFLDENLASGKIHLSNSPQGSPFFFIKKKNGGLCPCQDYQYVNEHTICNTYPLPLISDLVDKLRDAKIFTKFDVRWRYNNVQITDGHQWKAAFVTHKGLFEPTVMFFRLTNSPATFQRFMNNSFSQYDHRGMACYLQWLKKMSQCLHVFH